jgi:serine O-acetyltransferase
MFDTLRDAYRTHDGLCPGFWAVAVHHFGAWRYRVRPRVLRAPFYLVYRVAFVAVQMATGIELPCEVRLGRRFKIEHHSGIIINGTAQFGDDCVIRNGVTVGVRHTNVPGSPVIGDRVDIGAGAVLLGPIRIGDDVAIGANAVVITDVPSHSIAVGVPARIRPRRAATEALRPGLELVARGAAQQG